MTAGYNKQSSAVLVLKAPLVEHLNLIHPQVCDPREDCCIFHFAFSFTISLGI